MSRKPFVVTQPLRAKVKSIAALGSPPDHIAKMIGCTPETLRKHFRTELELGPAEANAVAAGRLFATAKGGNLGGDDLLVEDPRLGRSRP